MLEVVDRDRLLGAGERLENIVRIWKDHAWTIPRSAATEALTSYLIMIELIRPYDCYLPKHHVMIHPIQKTLITGNPWYYASWKDESLNKTLKGACRNASQLQFERTVLMRMVELLQDDHKKKRRRED